MEALALSGALKVLFAVVIAGLLATHGAVMYHRIRLMMVGPKENRFDRIKDRVGRLLQYGLGQGRMPDELVPGLLHIFIFAGFMILSVRTLELFVMGFGGYEASLHHIPVVGGVIGPVYSFVKDIVVILVITGCIGFMWRRLVSLPKRMQGMHHWEPVAILCWICGLMIFDMLHEGGYNAVAVANGREAHFGLGLLTQGMFNAESGATMWKAAVVGHSVMVLLFLNYLPFGKHFHVITALPNVFFSRLGPKGRIEPIRNIEEKFEQLETNPDLSIGIAKVEDVSWKQILDVYSCTECGRCAPYCPAFSTDKPLSHRGVNKSIKAAAYHKYPLEMPPFKFGQKYAGDEELVAAAQAKGAAEGKDAITALGNGMLIDGNDGAVWTETIWSCTLCGDCEDRCPVFIEQVPRIVQMRQYLSMIAGDIPAEITNYYKNIERNSNPWGLGPDKRADWIAKAGEGVKVRQFAELSPEELAEVEYLYYVGCMGSYDDRSQKITHSVCKILDAAGIKYAVLGIEEGCNGETARRLGNEYVGQIMAVTNIQTFMTYGVKKVITNCPHCFNTIKNEYPDFIEDAITQMETPEITDAYKGSAGFEVIHANELAHDLLMSGRIKLDRSKDIGRVGYHDPCFLGRYNGVFEQQRDLLRAVGAEVVEPSLNKKQSYCCGAGGGRMWVEEHAPRVNHTRFDEIMESCDQPATVGVSCPFCLTMLTDSSKDKQVDDKVKVKDVLEIVADHLSQPAAKVAEETPKEEAAEQPSA